MVLDTLRFGRRALLATAVFLVSATAQGSPIDEKVDGLLARMTLEEKVGQLNLVSREPDFDLESLRRGEVGAIINFPNPQLVAEMDGIARSSRLGIPLLVTIDLVHGYRTVFPLPIGMASSFDPDLVRRASAAAGRETLAAGINWAFAPMADVARDLRWGRVVEGFGEDPWLVGEFTAAQVHGFREAGIASTLKHFAGYSAVLGGRDYDVTLVPPTELYDTHLPPFRAGLRAGAESVMTALTALNGVPATSGTWLIGRVLRHDMGFRGLVVADWQAVSSLIKHGVARDGAEATRKAFRAGVDMDMTSGFYLKHLPGEVHAGRIDQSALDEAVRRVLRLKFGLGLFDRPVLDPARAQADLLRPETRAVAREAARASFVLLKNENGLLPIDPGKVKRVALVGPFADSQWDQLGPHEGNGQPGDVVTIRTGLTERAARTGVRVDYAQGCDSQCNDPRGFAAAVEAAQGADLIIAVLGEGRDLSGEGNSRANLGMPGLQQELLAKLAAIGKPIVLLVFGGRPVTLDAALERAGAAMMIWIPGTEGGPALADTLFGDADPSGRLPVSWPRSAGQMPSTYDRRPGGRPHEPGSRWTLGYNDESIFPIYPFGYGLSYTSFSYDTPEVLTPKLGIGPRAEPTLEVRASVTNTGSRAGRAVAQLYIHQPVASRSRPLRVLKGVALVPLAPGQTGTASFRVPARELGYHEPDGTLVVERGEYRAYVGSDSTAPLSGGFEVETGWREPTGSRQAANP